MDNFSQIFSSFNNGGDNSAVEFFSACGTGRRNLCLNKCTRDHSGIGCNLKISKKNRDACFAESRRKRDACKANCPSADQACIDEKNNPSGGGAYEPESTEVLEVPEKETPEKDGGSGKGAKGMMSGDTKKVLLYTGIAVGSIAGLTLLIWGVASAFKTSK